MIGGWMMPSRTAHDVLGGHASGARPVRGGAPTGGVGPGGLHRPVARAASSVFTDEFQSFRGTLGVGVKLCAPADPEAKGLVERANGYFETSFLPGRRFDDVADFNPQFTGWLRTGEPAHPRHHQGASGRGDLRGPRVDAGVPAGAARPVAALQCPAAPGSLRAGRHLRLLGQPALHRPPRRRARHPRRGRSPPAPASRSPATRRCLATHQTLTLPEHGQTRPPDARRAHRHRHLRRRVRRATRPRRLRPGDRSGLMATAKTSPAMSPTCAGR